MSNSKQGCNKYPSRYRYTQGVIRLYIVKLAYLRIVFSFFIYITALMPVHSEELVDDWVENESVVFEATLEEPTLFTLPVFTPLPLLTTLDFNDFIETTLSNFESSLLLTPGSLTPVIKIELTNNDTKPLVGPVRFAFKSLSPSNLWLTGSEGTMFDYKYVTIIPEGEELAVGASKTHSVNVIKLMYVMTLDELFASKNFSVEGGVYAKSLPIDTYSFTVDITSPETLLTIGASPVEVSGTINNAEADLTLNGVPISHQGGTFTAQVELTEGFNTVVARATTTEGEQVTDSIVISLDLTPPYLTIESHTEAQIVYSDKITVTGLVNDIVRGTVESAQAKVQVNGKAATVSNRSYAAHNVALTEGSNIIEITGVDSSGNSASIQQTVIYKAVTGSKLNLVAGQDQTGDIGAVLANALAVQLVDTQGVGIAGETVVFRVVQGAGEVGADTLTSSRALIVTTDANGNASTKFKLGFQAGVANHKVKAKVVGYENEVIFTASAISVTGNKVSINSGNNQRGIVSQSLPAPFIVAVSDHAGNIVQGARVRYDIKVGEGLFQNGETSYETLTDTDGRAVAQLTLGTLTGLDAQRIEAILLDGPDSTKLMAVFSATAFIAADPGNTSISGVVLTNQDEPIPGVTVRIEDTDRTTLTDLEGRFTIAQSPVGPVHIIVDGSTATIPGEYPSLSYHLVTVPGVENPMSAPVYMVKLDTENGVLAGKKDVVLTLDSFPGFKLEVAKDSVTFPDGLREGIISVTSVNASKVPMAPPNGMQPQFIVTIQPVGATFSPAAKLTLPNTDAELPGAQVEMYSYDHDLEEFVVIGLGTVSEDGSVISSNPGVGVIKAGWHCGAAVPGRPGSAFNCPECQKCTGSSCKIDNGIEPVDTIIGNCHSGSCRDGKPYQTYLIDDTDEPKVDTEIGNCFKPSCWRGTEKQNIEPDATDISEEDAKCKFCDGASGIKDKPDDTEIPDDECKICKGGVATDIDLEVIDTDTLAIGVPAPTLAKINDSLGDLKKLGIDVSVKAKTLSVGIKTEECCEKTLGKAEKITGSASGVLIEIDFEGKVWPPGPIPEFKSDDVFIGIATIRVEASFKGGIFAGGNAKASGTISKEVDGCALDELSKTGCIKADVSAVLAPKLNVQLTGDGCVVSKCLSCDDEVKACIAAGVKGEGKVTLEIGTIKYNHPKCGDGISAGVLSFAGANFDLTANIKGSVVVLGVTESIDEEFNFLSCQTSPIVSCT